MRYFILYNNETGKILMQGSTDEVSWLNIEEDLDSWNSIIELETNENIDLISNYIDIDDSTLPIVSRPINSTSINKSLTSDGVYEIDADEIDELIITFNNIYIDPPSIRVNFERGSSQVPYIIQIEDDEFIFSTNVPDTYYIDIVSFPEQEKTIEVIAI